MGMVTTLRQTLIRAWGPTLSNPLYRNFLGTAFHQMHLASLQSLAVVPTKGMQYRSNAVMTAFR